MDIKIYTDGGAINNPGPAASAYVIYLGNTIIHKESKKIGVNTNNIAEYTALVFAFEKTIDLVKEGRLNDFSRIVVMSDSRLMVNQLKGLFKVKNAGIRDMILKIRVLEGEIGKEIIYQDIPREKNTMADSLVKKALYS